MRNWSLILTLIFTNTLAFGQNDSALFFNEFCVSLNKTNVQDYNSNDGIGFGVGAYHTFLPDKIVNILLGFEYNRTSQFIENMYEGHFANATNLTYFINSLSIPITARFYAGKRIKIFFETGYFLDFSSTVRTHLQKN